MSEWSEDDEQFCAWCGEEWARCECPCEYCDGTGLSDESACIDDLCHGGEVPCMHGDWAALPCGCQPVRPQPEWARKLLDSDEPEA